MSSLDDTKTIRARQQAAGTTEDLCQIVCFNLDGDEYGLDVNRVEEIVRPGTIIPAADLPPYSVGTMSWRERNIPLVDLRARLGYPALEIDGDTRVIIVSPADRIFGVVVDSITEVLRLEPSRIDTKTDNKRGLKGDILKGMYRDDDNNIYILDCARMSGS